MKTKEAHFGSNFNHQRFSRKFLSNLIYYSVVPVTVWIFSYLYLRQFTPLYLDSWHDGYMLANAYAIRDGAVPYKDIFQIYGMTTSWIHGLIQPEDGHTVLSLRNLSVALSSLTAALICLTPLMGFKKWVSILSAILWIALADYSWSDDTWWVLPWSTVPTTLFITLLLLLVGVAIRLESQYAFSRRTPGVGSSSLVLAYLLSGLVVVALTFSRIVPGLLAAGGVFLILTLARPCDHRLRRLGSYLLGITVGMLIAFSYLNRFDAIEPFWYQTFGFSTGIFSMLFVFFRPGILAVSLLVFTGIVVVTFAVIIARFPSDARRIFFNRANQKKPIVFLLVTLIFSIFAVGFVYSYLRSGQLWGAIAFSGVTRFLFWFTFLLISIAIFFSLTSLFIQRSRHSASEFAQLNGITAVFAVISFSSIVPSISPRYVWWAMPIGLLVLMNVMRGMLAHINLHKIAALACAASVAILGCSLILGSGSLRETYKNEAEQGTGVFAGLYVSPNELEAITKMTHFVNENKKPNEKFYNWCPDPLPTFISGSFSSASSVPSNYIPGNVDNPWREELLLDLEQNPEPILVCKTLLNTDFFNKIRELDLDLRWTISADGNLMWLQQI